ncbi:MAG: hypothetical protein E7588_07870 [Ruminococcaceae bacterium]|nr:hypothetical protein [Oscillospiraceae bacterium]
MAKTATETMPADSRVELEKTQIFKWERSNRTRTSFGRSPFKNQTTFTGDELRKIREKQEVL